MPNWSLVTHWTDGGIYEQHGSRQGVRSQAESAWSEADSGVGAERPGNYRQGAGIG